MKIGIVTQPLLNNYGGILQNYALQQALIKIGHSPITLDFLPGKAGFSRIYAQFCRILLKTIGKYKGNWKYPEPMKRNNPYIIGFIERYIAKTPTFWNKYFNSLIKSNKIEAIIVGSDQVWRPIYNQDLKGMFLYFAKNYRIPKIAYAVSFGSSTLEYNEKQIIYIKKLIKEIKHISVREKDGIKLVEELGSKAKCVLDPTLLLTKKDYEKILPILSPKNSLTTYILDQKDNMPQLLNYLKNTLKIENLNELTLQSHNVGPIEWIQTIAESKYMITDSFHGTVFCILFHIPFLSIINKERGASRFLSLLQSLNLLNRLIHPEDLEDPEKLNEKINLTIDWGNVDLTLNYLRNDSMNFLETSLGSNN